MSSTEEPKPHVPPRRQNPYSEALRKLSVRTGAPLTSLAVSFAILHEVTAILPFAGIFYISRYLGAGSRTIEYIRATAINSEENGYWTKVAVGQANQWIDEGQGWVARVGGHYGIWGFEKGVKNQKLPDHIVGDVANALIAYAGTKALLPARVGLSLWLSPAFSRGILEPVRLGSVQLFRRFRL